MKKCLTTAIRLFRQNFKFILIIVIMSIVGICMLFYKVYERNISSSSPQIFIAVGVYVLLTLIVIGVLFWAKKKKWKIERIYLVCALILGICYIFALPIGLPQDENAHFYRAYELAELQIFPDRNNNMRQPSNLVEVIDSKYQLGGGYVAEIANISIQPSDEYRSFAGALDSNAPFSYIPYIIGIWLGKIFHLPLIPMLFLCRILGLVTCVVIIYFCIKYIPFMKKLVFLIGFLPVVMQVFAGVAGDALTICAGIALVTYVLYARNSMKRKLKWWDYALLLLICLTLSVSKVVYTPMCLMLFWIPKEKFASQKSKICAIVAFAIITILSIIARLLLTAPPNYRFANPELRIDFMLHQPIEFFVRIVQTIGISIPELAESMMGRWFSTYLFDFYTPFISIAVIFFILLCAEREQSIPRSLRILVISCLIIATLGFYASMFVIFSDLSTKTIEGVHGRYFLPIALLIPLAFLPSGKVKKRELIRPGYLYTFSTLANVYVVSVLIFSFL